MNNYHDYDPYRNGRQIGSVSRFDLGDFGSDRRDNNQDGGRDGKGGNKGNQRQNLLILLIATLITVVLISYFMRGINGSSTKEITYSEFMQMIDNNEVKSVVIGSDRITITPKETEENPLVRGVQVTYYTGKAEEDETLTGRLLKAGVEVSADVPDSSGMVMTFLLTYVLPVALMWILLSVLFSRLGRGGMMGSVGKSTAKEYVQKDTGVTFKDVGCGRGSRTVLLADRLGLHRALRRRRRLPCPRSVPRSDQECAVHYLY